MTRIYWLEFSIYSFYFIR